MNLKVQRISLETYVLTFLFLFFFTNIVWAKHYRITYEYNNGIDNASEVWFPLPKYSDGNGIKSLDIYEILPAPTSQYFDLNGNDTTIAYWSFSPPYDQIITISFYVELEPIYHKINEDQTWPLYDIDSDLYIKNTSPTVWAQSNNAEIHSLAETTIGGETNPYKKAKLLHTWVHDNIDGPPEGVRYTPDALTTLTNGWGDCAGHSNLFVALCRSLGIPARNVAGLISSSAQLIPEGNHCACDINTLNGHVWAEFYLPGYGWVQCDPNDRSQFGIIPDERIIHSKGNDIKIKDGFNSYDWWNVIDDQLSWLTIPRIPHQSACGGALCFDVQQTIIGDHDNDLDVDGSDLVEYISSLSKVSIEIFSMYFGFTFGSENTSIISVDGSLDEWSGIDNLIDDTLGDSLLSINGTDISAISLAKDSDNLYIAYQLADGPPNEEAWYQLTWVINGDMNNCFDTSLHYACNNPDCSIGAWVAEFRKKQNGIYETVYLDVCEIGNNFLEGKFNLQILSTHGLLIESKNLEIRGHVFYSPDGSQPDETEWISVNLL
jgi:hypothetical protein